MKETRSKNKGQKTVREILEDIMKSEVRDEKLREKLSACGLEGKNQNMKTALVYSLYELARNGNSKSVDIILGLLNENEEKNRETVINVNIVD